MVAGEKVVAAAELAVERGHLVTVVAPAVGVIRLAPDAVVGASVNPGDQVAEIEAMKMTTPVRAARAGVIREVCVRDVVEFEQVPDADD